MKIAVHAYVLKETHFYFNKHDVIYVVFCTNCIGLKLFIAEVFWSNKSNLLNLSSLAVLLRKPRVLRGKLYKYGFNSSV